MKGDWYFWVWNHWWLPQHHSHIWISDSSTRMMDHLTEVLNLIVLEHLELIQCIYSLCISNGMRCHLRKPKVNLSLMHSCRIHCKGRQ